MLRSWGIVSLSGSAQPWFGDKLTAAVALPLGGIIAVTVASTAKYQGGDRILLDPGQTNQDALLVDQIFSATVLYCRSEGGALTHTHASNALILLSIACAEIIVTNLSTANPVVLGSDNTVTVTPGGSAFTVLYESSTQASIFRLTNCVEFNAVRTSDGWMIGTSGQSVGVAAIVV